MIDQKLGINILNNLLCIQASEEQQGDESQRDAALNSEFITATGPDARTCIKFNTASNITGALEGGCLEEAKGTSSSRRYQEDVATQRDASVRMAEIKALYEAPTPSFTQEVKELYVPIEAVSPEVSKLNNEKQKIYAIGMLKSQLNQILEDLDSLNLVYCNFENPKDTKALQDFKDSIQNLNTDLKGISTYFKKQVLNNLPYYANASYSGGYTYKTNSDGSENVTRIIASKRITIQVYTYHEETHYFGINYKMYDRTYTLTDEATYCYYKRQPQVVEVTLDSWYYSQVFSTAAYYPEKAYIGLFTDYNHSNDLSKNSNGMPNADGTGFREPPFKQTNPSEEQKKYTYQRMDLHRGLFTDGYVFNNIKQATEEDVVGKDEPNELLGKAYLKNSEIIMFPEILTQEEEGELKGWGKIYGFGIFANEKPAEGETPFFWGPVMDAPVETAKEEVPLFRPSQFEIFLG